MGLFKQPTDKVIYERYTAHKLTDAEWEEIVHTFDDDPKKVLEFAKAEAQKAWDEFASRHPEASTTVAAPVVITKTYNDAKDYAKDAKTMTSRGFLPQNSVQGTQKVAAMRTVGKGVLTGGVGLLVLGRAHKGGQISVTWVKTS